MLIYKQAQHGGVKRTTLHCAGWISFALVVMMVAPSVSQATLECVGTPEFKEQCEKAIQEVHDTTPVGQAMVDKLRESSNPHVIEQNPNPFAENGPYNRDAANDLESGGDGTGSGTSTLWNPTTTNDFPDGVARDPTASMQHELWHAFTADTGGRSLEVVPDTEGIGRREIDATIVENDYREAVGLDPRTEYCRMENGGVVECADVPRPGVPETSSSILMFLIGIGALWCLRLFLRPA